MKDVLIILLLGILILLQFKQCNTDVSNTEPIVIDSLVSVSSKDTVLVIKEYTIQQDFSPINNTLNESYVRLSNDITKALKGKINDSLLLSLQQLTEQYRYTVDSTVLIQQQVLIQALQDSLEYIKQNPPILFDKKRMVNTYDINGNLDVTTEYYGSIVHQYVSGTMQTNKSLNNISIFGKGATNFNGLNDFSIGLHYQRNGHGIGISRSFFNGSYELYLHKQLKNW